MIHTILIFLATGILFFTNTWDDKSGKTTLPDGQQSQQPSVVQTYNFNSPVPTPMNDTCGWYWMWGFESCPIHTQ